MENVYKINVDMVDPVHNEWEIDIVIKDSWNSVLAVATRKPAVLPDMDTTEALRAILSLQFAFSDHYFGGRFAECHYNYSQIDL